MKEASNQQRRVAYSSKLISKQQHGKRRRQRNGVASERPCGINEKMAKKHGSNRLKQQHEK